MCGIVALIRNRNKRNNLNTVMKLQSIFKDLITMAQLRGNAASGMFSSNTNIEGEHRIQTLRCPLRAEDMLKTKSGGNMLRSFNNFTNFMVGHTRAATPGAGTSKNNFNNHPHVCGNIIGVHNGVIDKEIPAKFLQGRYEPKGACDSELLFAMMDLKNKSSGITQTSSAIKETLLVVKGWYSVLMMDVEKPQDIYIMRDSLSPLEYIWWPEGSCYIVASELWMLNKIVEKYKLKKTSSLIIMDKVVFNLNTTRIAKNGMLSQRALYIDPPDNTSYINKHKKAYEKTQGR